MNSLVFVKCRDESRHEIQNTKRATDLTSEGAGGRYRQLTRTHKHRVALLSATEHNTHP